MNIKRRIYWIIISVILTAFGTYELYQLVNTFIYERIATKSSTLTLNADFLVESLGITVCYTIRPNMTFLKEHNISENIFNYGLSYYHTIENLKVVGDPSMLR